MELNYSPYNPKTDEDPYSFYGRLRDEAPVYRNSEDDFWALSRNTDVMEALRDSGRYSCVNGPRLEPEWWGPDAEKVFSFVAMDPPHHTRMRSLVAQGFTRRRIAGLERQVRDIVRQHLRPVLAQGAFDLMTDFAVKVPMDVISEFMGVPKGDQETVRDLSLVISPPEGENPDPSPETRLAMGQAVQQLMAYYAELIADRKKKRRGDFVSELLDASEDGERLSEQELVSVLVLLIGAGVEPVKLLLGNAWYAASCHPEKKAQALDGRVEDWLEETMRYDPPSQAVARSATEEFELHGVSVPADARILLLLGSANRDERAFKDPDRFDLDRDRRRNTTPLASFGGGRHHCLGAHLARLETRVVLEEFSAAARDYEIDTTKMRRLHSVNARGFASLPVTVTPR